VYLQFDLAGNVSHIDPGMYGNYLIGAWKNLPVPKIVMKSGFEVNCKPGWDLYLNAEAEPVGCDPTINGHLVLSLQGQVAHVYRSGYHGQIFRVDPTRSFVTQVQVRNTIQLRPSGSNRAYSVTGNLRFNSRGVLVDADLPVAVSVDVRGTKEKVNAFKDSNSDGLLVNFSVDRFRFDRFKGMRLEGDLVTALSARESDNACKIFGFSQISYFNDGFSSRRVYVGPSETVYNPFKGTMREVTDDYISEISYDCGGDFRVGFP
jgi:hypothetical protein